METNIFQKTVNSLNFCKFSIKKSNKGQISLEVMAILIFLAVTAVFGMHYFSMYVPNNYQKTSATSFYTQIRPYQNIELYAWNIDSDGTFQVEVLNRRSPHTIIVKNFTVTVDDTSVEASETEKFDVSIPIGQTGLFSGYGLGTFTEDFLANVSVIYEDSITQQQFYMRVMLNIET